MLDFTFWTGGDDLRDDSVVVASLGFRDGSAQLCPLHGAHASSGIAHVSWDNRSTHAAPPCRLEKPRTLRELKEASVTIGLYAPGSAPSTRDLVASAGMAALTIRSQDNWDIARVVLKAYNPDSSTDECVRSANGNPLARLTGDEPKITLSDFPNRCR